MPALRQSAAVAAIPLITRSRVAAADGALPSAAHVFDVTLDLTSGEVDMTGAVNTGWHAGAVVPEKGRLVDPATITYAGDIVLLVRPGGRGS